MTPQEIIQLVLGFLSGGLVGGVVVALLDWWRISRSERHARQVEFIRLQLQNLYGPLQFFTSCNAKLFEMNDGFQKAYTQEYVEKQWSQEYNTQENVNRAASQALDIANEYIEQVKKNNVHILAILESQYSLIETTDIEVFTQFVVDYTRMNTEVDETGRLETPFEIYQHLGSISFMRPDFINAVDKRFKEKKSELEKLLR
jgi:hypothetical protein